MANEFKIRKGLIVEGATGGTVVDVQGSLGQLFSVTDNLTGEIFAVADISGVPIMSINSNGKVGIGTSSPATGLDIQTSYKQLTLGNTTGTQAGAMQFRRGGDGQILATIGYNGAALSSVFQAGLIGGGGAEFRLTSGNATSSVVTISTASGEAMRVLGTNGNVGINTTGPTEKLDVDGNTRIRSLTAGIVTSSATGVLSTGGPTPLNSSLGEGYAANIREKYYRTNRTVYPSTIGSQYAQLIQQGTLNDLSLIMSPIATQRIGDTTTHKVCSALPSNNLGDFSFNRTTSATRINSEGHVEGENRNYVTYSNEPTNTAWAKGTTTVLFGFEDPNGTFTANKVTLASGSNSYLGNFSLGITGQETVSAWIRADSAMTIGFNNGQQAGIANITTSWVRYEFKERAAGSGGGIQFDNYAAGVSPAQQEKIFYIYYSQVNSGFGATDYIGNPGTTQNKTGIIVNAPRIDYLNKIPELLVELTSTNVCFDSASPILSNTTLTPCISPAGINNGVRITEVANTAQHYAFFNANVAINTQYYFSIYIKKGTESEVSMYTESAFISSAATVNLENGTFALAGGTNGAMIDAGNGWYRFSYLTPTSVAANASMDIYITVIDLGSRAGDASKFTDYYGPQLETCITQGGPSSFIPTFNVNTTGITRTNEVMSVSDMSSNIIASGANSATLMLDLSYYYSGTAGDAMRWYQPGSITGRGYIYQGAMGFADSWGSSTFTVSTVNTKVMWRLNSLTSGTFFKDGVKGNTVGGTAWTGVNTIEFLSNYGSFRIRNIFMASTALTDAQCVNLTTINE